MADPGALAAPAQCDVLWSLAVLDTLSADIFARLAAQLEQQPLAEFRPEVLPSCLALAHGDTSESGFKIMLFIIRGPVCWLSWCDWTGWLCMVQLLLFLAVLKCTNAAEALTVLFTVDTWRARPEKQRQCLYIRNSVDTNCCMLTPTVLIPLQDFQQLYQAQLFARACPWWQDGAGAGMRLAPWLQQYASRTWQDRIDTERSFTPLQQVRAQPLYHSS